MAAEKSGSFALLRVLGSALRAICAKFSSVLFRVFPIGSAQGLSLSNGAGNPTSAPVVRPPVFVPVMEI